MLEFPIGTTSPLWQARYYKSVLQTSHLPPFPVAEIVFAGRSNAGKSSAINALCQQKQLAFASKTPGRTQTINFYAIGGGHVAQHRNDPIDEAQINAFLVDLPGYGYASAAHSTQSKWQTLLSYYIAQRPQVQGLVLVMDSRHPLQALDQQLIELYAKQKKPLLLLLTKADKLTHSARRAALSLCTSYCQQLPGEIACQIDFFSTLKREGLRRANDWICQRITDSRDAVAAALASLPVTNLPLDTSDTEEVGNTSDKSDQPDNTTDSITLN